MNQLENKVALITGASSGIGRATARLFASEGARVVVGARRKPELESLVSEIHQAGGEAVSLSGDVIDPSYAEALVACAVENFGGLDIALNNAGTLGDLCSVTDMSLENWRTTLEVNLTSGFLGAKYQIPAMQRQGGGSIIFTASFVGHTTGMPGMGSYGASKAGLIGLMLNLASEFSHENIRANALLPGGTDTDMAAEVANTPEIKEYIRNLHALKRTASPDEIAHAALFLASDASSFTTGHAMIVDGGFSIHRA